MKLITRRRTLQLASSFAATAPLLAGGAGRAQQRSDTVAAVFDMASFSRVDADAAFAEAMAAVSRAAADAAKAGKPAQLTLNLTRDAVYRIKQPLAFKQLNGFALNGNGAQLINTTRGTTLLVSGSNHVTIRDLTIDYDPLPFTQGTIASFDHAALQIMVKVDPGYPDDPAFLSTITDGFLKVMDRGSRALKAGARDFLTPSKVERVAEGVIRVHLRWSANDTFPSQLPVAVGDAVAITNGFAHAVVVDGSTATTFSNVNLFASPGMGILENGGPGAMTLRKVSIVPGPRPKGATSDRLVSTNSDGSHFITVEHGPTMEDCSFANTSDDAVNVHGFYYYVVRKTGPGRYTLTPKWDIGLAAGDEIESCERGTFRSLGQTRITQLTKRHAPELKTEIAKIWNGKSPPTQPDLIYEVVLQQDLPLKVADAVTSLSRIGSGTAIRRCSFHACGHVVVKSPNSVVEDCQFSYSSTIALQAGSDIGYWSESGFAENLTFRNNRFIRCITGANALTAGNGALGTIYIGMSGPEGAKGFSNNFQNRNVTIAGNRIDDSYIYAIFVGNADGLKITGNVVGRTFIRGSAFDAGQFYGIKPDSAIFVGRVRNAEIADNTAARGQLARTAVTVDKTCEARTVHLANNRLV
ncbi:MAG: right-handed parallel beta-helix repeat-containing protein [Xanthobacteraceae bacterium]|nr:right-handed parallel beta-helix repeat-containing protein [Xanthobacteraceae bacterium]